MDWGAVILYLSGFIAVTLAQRDARPPTRPTRRTEPRGYVYFKPEYQSIGEKAKGKWTRWFNGDNPFIFDEQAPGGDVETVEHQRMTYGYHCDWGMPCNDPIGFEVNLSRFWKWLYPNATFQESFACSNIDQVALTQVGQFQCSNLAQFNQQWEDSLPDFCFSYCQRSGQMYFGKQDPRFARDILPNCRVCPDFHIRFFCLDSDLNCISKSEWLEWLNYLLEQRQQSVNNRG